MVQARGGCGSGETMRSKADGAGIEAVGDEVGGVIETAGALTGAATPMSEATRVDPPVFVPRSTHSRCGMGSSWCIGHAVDVLCTQVHRTGPGDAAQSAAGTSDMVAV